MDAQDLIGRRVTITDIDLDALSSFDVAHVAFTVDDGAALVLKAYLHQARGKGVLILCDEAGRCLAGTP